MIELTETYCHLAASRSRCRNYYERTRRVHIVILSETFFRVDESHIIWIAFNGIMVIDLYIFTLQTLSVCICTCLTVVVGYDHAADI